MKSRNKNINVPNALSLSRIILIVPFVYFFLNDRIIPAAVCLVLSGISDMLDGMIARKFNQFTELGQMLDPLADKLTQGAVAICLAIEQPILIPLLAIFILKELLMLFAASFLVLKKKKRPSGSKWYGKVATILFYVSFVVIVALKGFFHIENLAVTVTLLSVTAAFMIYAFVQYFKIFLELMHSNDPKDNIDLKADMKARKTREDK
ncbi:CDP-alcohol phosphatidyltransferase family protein [Clostridium sp. D33t1_170424_F3]|uniref:CDP-alcohol phosphatidyltransferase family protein n=1 Tax=Clostridium sp. D33t1_170424_F3 TaxID=2787099 RepID=UPI0018A91102|nr:CDP-alcohol phosphatidyltransferase family protein [Clostridium sp. D33t1_170424_F3]